MQYGACLIYVEGKTHHPISQKLVFLSFLCSLKKNRSVEYLICVIVTYDQLNFEEKILHTNGGTGAKIASHHRKDFSRKFSCVFTQRKMLYFYYLYLQHSQFKPDSCFIKMKDIMIVQYFRYHQHYQF